MCPDDSVMELLNNNFDTIVVSDGKSGYKNFFRRLLWYSTTLCGGLGVVMMLYLASWKTWKILCHLLKSLLSSQTIQEETMKTKVVRWWFMRRKIQRCELKSRTTLSRSRTRMKDKKRRKKRRLLRCRKIYELWPWGNSKILGIILPAA